MKVQRCRAQLQPTQPRHTSRTHRNQKWSRSPREVVRISAKVQTGVHNFRLRAMKKSSVSDAALPDRCRWQRTRRRWYAQEWRDLRHSIYPTVHGGTPESSRSSETQKSAALSKLPEVLE